MPDTSNRKRPLKTASTLDALIPVIALVALLGASVYLYDAIGGPVQVALILCAMLAGMIGYKNGHSVEKLGKAAVDSISAS